MAEIKEYKTITREQFLFHEMRTTARLMLEGNSDPDILKEIKENNLFQYPTEKMITNLAGVCLKRIHNLGDERLTEMIANGSLFSSKQACLYAMMKYYHLVWDYMTTVIAEKYRTKDFSYSRRDLNSFFTRLQEQNDEVASWSDETIKKCKSVLNSVLVENEYLDSPYSKTLNSVLIDQELENILTEKKDYAALAAYNCFKEV